jgi:hypothetical protein
MKAEPRLVDTPEFTDRFTLRLIPCDEVDAEVLRDLIAAIETAREQLRGKPVRMKGRKPEKTEHAKQRQAVSRAFTRIEQIAAASQPEAEQLAHNIKADGPTANTAEIAAAIADLNDAVEYLHSLRGHIAARPLE